MTPEACRLCGGPTRHRFERLILQKFSTAYFECSSCGSLQTQMPHWLDEAYAIAGVHVDVGQAARVVQTWLRLVFVLQNIGFDCSSMCIDYGGSAGLLTRLMRDSGYNYFAYDSYDDSKYANYFRINDLNGLKPSLISAFEVLEHLPRPGDTLAELLSMQPELIVFTTQFYEGQGSDWTYLVPFCGQHVFFYTPDALRNFAAAFDYDVKELAGFWAMVRRQSPYSARIDQVTDKSIDASFVGEHVTKVGWGTEATTRDSVYAVERFINELKRV